MGIYIPNMEMPKTCQICRTAKFDRIVGCEEWDRLSIAQRMYMRSETCPLDHIPEGHGRLIDADAFKADCLAATKEANPDFIRHEDWLKSCAITMSFCRDIDEQPTIVPAEGGGEDG